LVSLFVAFLPSRSFLPLQGTSSARSSCGFCAVGCLDPFNRVDVRVLPVVQIHVSSVLGWPRLADGG
jgi:hypothetical protein